MHLRHTILAWLAGRAWITAWALALALASSSCGRDSAIPTNSDDTVSHSVPSASALSDKLQEELARLGKDFTKQVAVAPAGSDNAPFDLSALPLDSSGDPLTPEDISGGAEVSSIRLEWTEQLIGDYDQNGEVNLSDVTPLAQHWEKTVAYDSPALHGGFDAWPGGNPDDAPSGSPAANNWRLARTDGDANTEINLADITPIALHWQEALSGYRVYRKGPSESSFTALENGGAGAITQSQLSLERPLASTSLPVRYAFSDAAAPVLPGVYQYYCAPLDSISGNEGPASGVVSIDLATGAVNKAPVAQLAVSPDFAGAPAQITFDASESYDPDGTVVELEWDIDSDGITDLLATDATPPDTSSAGTITEVDTIAPGGAWPPPIVSGKCIQGSNDWLYPKVRAIDDEGLAGAWQSAKLGVSGWVLEKLYDEAERNIDFEVDSVYPGAVSRDPLSGEAVIVGKNNNDAVLEVPGGVYIAWREGPGQWRQERVVGYDDPVWQIDAENRYGQALDPQVHWIGGQPVVGFASSEKNVDIVWLARREGPSQWQLSRLPDGFLGMDKGSQLSTNRFATLIAENGANATPADWWVLDMSASGWTLKETGYTSSGFPDFSAGPPYSLALLEGKLKAVLPYNTSFTTSQIPVLSETDSSPWLLAAADEGELAGNGFACIDMVIQPNGDWYFCVLAASASSSPQANSLAIISGRPGSFEFQPVRDFILQPKSSYLYVDGQTVAVFSKDTSTFTETNSYNSVFYDRLEPGGQLSETIISRQFTEENHESVYFQCGYSFPSGGAFCTVSHSVSGQTEELFGRRVDPRF